MNYQDNSKYRIAWPAVIIIAVFCLLSPARVIAAIAHVENKEGSGSGSSVTTSAALTNVTDHLYLAAVVWNDPDVTSVTGASGMGLTWTLLKSQCGAQNKIGVALYWAKGDGGSNGTVTVNFSNSSPANIALGVNRYSGVDPISPVGTAVSENANGGGGTDCGSGGQNPNAYVSLTTGEANAWAFAAVGNRMTNDGVSVSNWLGHTPRDQHGVGSGSDEAYLVVADQLRASTGSYNTGVVYSGDSKWGVIAVEIKPLVNSTPDDPTINDHNNGVITGDNTPTLGFTQSDPDASEQVKYRIQIDDTDNTFSSLVVDYTSDYMAEGATSFTVGQAAGSGTYNTYGSEGQTLPDGHYFWRVMTTDDYPASSGWTIATSSNDVAFTVHTAPSYRSIGTDTGTLFGLGTASVNRLSKTVTFTADLPDPASVGAVGPGDKLVLNGETFYILSRDSARQVTVQIAATDNRSGTPTITRSYNTIQTWENDRDGNLVSENRNEVGVCYKDGTFTAGATINDSTTDATHYMRLTVAQGQRHDGTAGSGVKIDPNPAANGITASDAYTIVEWLEIAFFCGNDDDRDGVNINANYVTVRNNLIHDDVYWGAAHGIYSNQATSPVIYNNIIYGGSASNNFSAGIYVREMGGTPKIYNNTVYDAGVGIWTYWSSNPDVRNNLSYNNSGGDFYAQTDSWDANSDYNFSKDDSAPGGNSIHGDTDVKTPDFISTTEDSENLHLQSSSDAIDAATPLSGTLTADADNDARPLGSQWDIGADESATRTIYRSIGTDTSVLYSTGTVSVSKGSTTVTFGGGASLPLATAVGAVGPGDVLTIAGETFYILSRDSATQVTVQNPAAAAHTNASYTIARAYNTIQDWEDARDGDLVTEDRLEVGVAYKDGTFTAGATINDSTTDATHYMQLTVADGQRHDGTAGTGVLIDPSSTGHVITVSDEYTIVEWLEISDFGLLNQYYGGVYLSIAANTKVRYNLIHDNIYYAQSVGVYDDGSAGGHEIYNNIIYCGPQEAAMAAGISTYGPSAASQIYNNTVYNSASVPDFTYGIEAAFVSNVDVRNNVAIGFDTDFRTESATWHSSSNNNLDSDGTAPGAQSQHNKTAANQFESPSGSIDLHLKSGADAIDTGVNPSAGFTDDIDEDSRPQGPQWDIGADEYIEPNTAPSAPTTLYVNNVTAQNGTANPTGVTDPNPAFSAIYNDPDSGDTANKYRVEVNTQSDFGGTVMWESGPTGTSMTDTTTGNRCEDIIYAGSELKAGTTYYWRITFWDDGGLEGTASTYQQFTMAGSDVTVGGSTIVIEEPDTIRYTFDQDMSGMLGKVEVYESSAYVDKSDTTAAANNVDTIRISSGGAAGIGDIGIWRDSAGGQVPGTTVTFFNFATEQRNDGSYTFTGGNTCQLDNAGNYLFITTLKFEDTSAGRVNYESGFTYTGSGSLVGSAGTGYSRDANNNTAWVRIVGLVWGAAATDTVKVQVRRDLDDPLGGSIANASHFQVVRLHDSAAVGLYNDTTDTGAYGTQTWTDAPYNNIVLENDTSVIQRQAGNTDFRLKKDATTFLIGYGLAFGTGGNRTQRVTRMVAGATSIEQSYSYAYQRDANNEYVDPNGLFLYRNSGTSTDLTVQAQRGNALDTGSAVRRINTSGIFIVELPAGAEVFISHDSTAGQDVGGTSGDLNIMRDVNYNDAAAFTKVDNTAMNSEKAMDVLLMAQVYVERTGTGGTRMTTGSRFEIQGADQTLGEHGNYLRGAQNPYDTYNAAFYPAGMYAVSSGDDVQVEWFDAGENGSTDYTQADAVGFSALNLDSLTSVHGTKDDSADTFVLLETGSARTRVRGLVNDFVNDSVGQIDQDATVYAGGVTVFDRSLVVDTEIDATGSIKEALRVHQSEFASGSSAADGTNKALVAVSTTAGEADFLQFPYSDFLVSPASGDYGKIADADSFEVRYVKAGTITTNTYTTQLKSLFLETGLTSTSSTYTPYVNDFRNPATPSLVGGFADQGLWNEDGDSFNQAEGAYTLTAGGTYTTGVPQLGVDLDGSTYQRYYPVLKIRHWTDLTPQVYNVEGVGKNLGIDFNASVVPFTDADLFNDNAGSGSYTDIAEAGDIDDADEKLAALGQDQTLTLDEAATTFGATPDGDAIYFGSAGKFFGVNIDLATAGVGGAGKWQYYSGAAWADITNVYETVSGAETFLDSGAIYWDDTDVSSWAATTVNSSLSLYFVRFVCTTAYSTHPVENQIKTDILIFQDLTNTFDTATSDTIQLYTIPPTAIGLMSFSATGSGNDIRVDWHTGHEIANLGFNIYRATNKGGPYTKINSALIPGLNYSALGKTYSFMDTDVTPGRLYYYKLEDIDVYGKHTFHGPVCVDWDADGMPDDWEIRYRLNPWVNDADIDSDGDGLTNREEYELGTDPFNPDTDGDGILDGQEFGVVEQPDEDGSRVLTRGVEVIDEDETGVTLELLTDSFDTELVQAAGSEFERLRIADYIHGYTAEIGQPELPLKGILIDMPAGMAAALSILETEVAIHGGYQIFPVPEPIVDAQGAAAAIGESFIQDEAAYQQDVFYPQDVAQLVEVYTFRDQVKQQLVFYPIRFNAATGDLRHYRRIRVRIDYVDNYLAQATDINPTPWKVPTEQGLPAQIASMGTMAMAFGASPLIVNPLSPALSSLGLILSAVWAPPADAGATAYKILTADAGIYRIYRSDLALDDDLSQIRLYNLGQEVAIYIYDQNSNNYLDTSDYIEFYAQTVAAAYSKYARDNVYWLVTSGGTGSPKHMPAVDGIPAGGSLGTAHSYLQHQEQDTRYMGLAPGADGLDRWYYYQYVLGIGFTGGPDPVPYDFALPVFGNQGPGSLTISLWGYSDTAHDLEVWVNGVYKDTFYWSGITYNEVSISSVDVKDSVIDQSAQSASLNTITLAASASTVDDDYNEMLIEITAGTGSNQVRKIIAYNGATRLATVESNWTTTPDAGSIYRIDTAVTLICDSGDDAFVLDWMELTYDRDFSAVADSLQFAHDSGYRYIIDDFSTNDLLIFDISDPTDVATIENAVISGADPYSLEFEPPINPGATETYLIISAADYKNPVSISQDSSSDLADTDNEADYILITHKDIGWDGAGDPYSWLDDLVELREDGGLAVKVIDVADIYDEFSYGLTSAVAIRDFLAYAYDSWQTPAPRYVLLVGDSSFDYKDNLDIGTINYVPGFMVVADYMGEAVTDEYFVRISGDDAIPDMYIGRLPAESQAQAQSMVAKIKDYEETIHQKDWRQKVLLVADDKNEDYEAVFETMNEDAIALLPSKMVPLRGYLEGSTAGAIAAFIDTNIGSGALIMNYSGHGAMQSWASPSIFADTAVPDLDNNGKYPFVISMSCLTGNFGFVSASKGQEPSLAEVLLQADSEGAVAALMPTAMTTTTGQHILNTALFEAFFTDDIRELGPAILSAKQVLLANGSSEYEQLSETFLLFGDPAMALKIPLPRMPTGVAAYRQEDGGVRISWNAALDSNGNAVAGYHVYRASSPAGPYSKISTELVSGTEFVDTSGAVGGAGAGAGGGSYYYAVSSEDDDGDESAQSLGISPAALASTASSTVGCFIGSVGESIPAVLCWILAILAFAVVITQWLQASGARRMLAGKSA